jgi:hypothetical protein
VRRSPPTRRYDPEYIEDDAPALDADVEYEGEGTPPDEARGNEDPAPNAP